MKKISLKFVALIVILAVIVSSFIGCFCFLAKDDPKRERTYVVLSSLPDYNDYDSYMNGVFQDFTIYRKYYYSNVTEADFEGNKYFKKLTNENMPEFEEYLINYENWVDGWGGQKDDEVYKSYDFSRELLKEGNYFYIYDKAVDRGDTSWKFSSYDIYYFDMSSQTLYFMHNNI